MIVRAIRFIFGIYAAVIFALTLLLVAPAYILIFSLAPKDKSPHLAHRYVSYSWARILLVFFLVRLRVKNKELIDSKQKYVFVSNHRSMLDIPAYALASTNTFRFLSKEELTRIPVLGYIIKNLYITVNRKDKNDRARSMEAMLKSLEDGVSIFIAPEGTRNKSDQPLMDFRDGAFRIAIAAQVQLAVLTLKNTDRLLSPVRPVELKPGIITATWSKPIETKGMTMADLENLKLKARELMMENL